MEKTYTVNHEVIKVVAEAIKDLPYLSAWKKGVREYALELLDQLHEEYTWQNRHHEIDYENGFATTRNAIQKVLLSGASDWDEYSAGDCSMVYEGEIAARLCSPSQLKRYDGGTKTPRNYDSWIEVQAGALHQAAALVLEQISIHQLNA